eukprot:c5692_g1_i1.p1 GENE.c5692_g1_i1~~c5692_g1_i1.p1  ORF type:complete len:983 (-),score=264.61 c5692_g1_i1:147-3095(-)
MGIQNNLKLVMLREVVVLCLVGLSCGLPKRDRDQKAASFVQQDDPTVVPSVPRSLFQFWTDVSITTGSFPHMTVVDLDHDGVFEVFLSGSRSSNVALKYNATSKQLEDVASAWGLAGQPDQFEHGVVSCDVDGDGREEILQCDPVIGEMGQGDRLLHWDTIARTFIPQTLTYPQFTAPIEFVGCLDPLGYGVYDVIMGDSTGQVKTTNLHTGVQSTLIEALPTESGVSAAADGIRNTYACLVTAPLAPHAFPQSHLALDLYLCNEAGPNPLLSAVSLNTSHTQFLSTPLSERTSTQFNTVKMPSMLHDTHGNTRGAAIVNVLGATDSLLGLVLANAKAAEGSATQSQPRILVESPNGLFADVTSPVLQNIKGELRGVVVADFDNDGKDEIFFHIDNGPNIMFHQVDTTDGVVEWGQVNIGEAADDKGQGGSVAVVDVDSDGSLELIITHGSLAPATQAPVLVFRPRLTPPATTTPSHYLRVMPYTRFGAPARGAMVELVCATNNRKQIRVVDAGGASSTQQEPIAHFGLGSCQAVYSVRVTWPDGQSVTHSYPDIDRILHVQYPISLNPSPSAAPVASTDAECHDDSCLSKQVTCPTSGESFSCGVGYYFDRVAGPLSISPASCYCRKGIELSPCPEVGSASSCDFGFSFQRTKGEDGVEKCFCRKDDGIPRDSDNNGSNSDGSSSSGPPLSPADKAKLEACLDANPTDPTRCITLMQALGYPLSSIKALIEQHIKEQQEGKDHHHHHHHHHNGSGGDDGEWDSDSDSDDVHASDVRYALPSCPLATEADPCGKHFYLQRLVTGSTEQCSCVRKSRAPLIEVSPCPTSHASSACQPGYHLAPSTTDKCFCVKDAFEIAPCPLRSANTDGLCDSGFHFERLMDGAKEVCQCQRSFWETPCPVDHGDCDHVCPEPYKLKREVSALGTRCSCSDPAVRDHTKNPFWHKECEYCAYGYGDCHFQSSKGWYCKCSSPTYTGPDCIMD